MSIKSSWATVALNKEISAPESSSDISISGLLSKLGSCYHDWRLMGKSTFIIRRFRLSTQYFLSVLLALCFSCGAPLDASPHTPETDGIAGRQSGGAEGFTSSTQQPAKSVMPRTQVLTRGVIRTKHSPLYPAALPPERIDGLFSTISFSLINIPWDVPSLAFFSRSYSRAPPRLA